MTIYLQRAMKGDALARQAFMFGWCKMLLDGLSMDKQDVVVKLDILCNLFGKERVAQIVTHSGPDLTPLDWTTTVDEALGSGTRH